MNKDEVLRLRLGTEEKELIRRAAARARLSMSEFTLQAALVEARRATISVVTQAEPIPGQLTLSGGLTLSERS